MKRKFARKGVLQLEAIAALTILLFVLAAFATFLFASARSGHILIDRQRGVLAAEAVLNEARAGIRLSDEAWSERYDDITIRIEREPGAGEFNGCEMWTVRVETQFDGRTTGIVSLKGAIPMVTENDDATAGGDADEDA